ncbi:Hpt domain-containing protein [Methylobacterium sp. J-030]|uniref:Hpt domain-containing protein n=1 Tax=Methylobacterium sp. J-030 TaxID=2836627 RepID=UPI001FBADF5C|nr:Hpt domain-containing protein [Methylobacterium sp. J-030]MCJ2073826.1 Hpt domain-containing protein [Methylobacterium sp. J-030]
MSHALVNREALDELSAVIGPEKLARIVDRFLLSLASAVEEGDRTAADYGREAHTLVSMSGMLGCDALSRACRAVEEAAAAGHDLTDSLAALRMLRDQTVVALQDLGAVIPATDQPAITASSGASKVRTAPSGG